MSVVLHNGRFLRSSQPGARDDATFDDCLVLDQDLGLITYVGSVNDDAVAEAKTAGAASQDMCGLVVVPGLIDSHMHLLLTGESLNKLFLGSCKTLEEIQSSIRSYAQANPDMARILCRGWFHSSTGGSVLASQLDDLDPRPIYIDADDLHSTWCSTPALREMGVAEMDDPPGGTIHRGADGQPSGLLSESAAVGIAWPFLSSVWPLEAKLGFLEDAFAAYMKAGYTGVVEMAMDEHLWDLLQVYRQRRGTLPIWLAAHWLILPRASEQDNLKQVDRAIKLSKQFNTTPDCRMAGIKIMVDGVVDACTAALREPYSHNHQNADTAWALTDLVPVLRRADKANLQCALHAIGDAAVGLAIDALEQVDNPAGRHRIEHLEMCSPDDARRLGKLGIIASVQPVHSDPSTGAEWPRLIGPERCAHIFPYASMARHGAVLALGSDAPTAPYEPLPILYVATTRRSALEPDSLERTTPQFALSLAAAVAAATEGAAYSCFAERQVGRLESGMVANLTVVDMEWDEMKLLDAKVVETWYQGRRI